ncbi:DNA double-strand break repair nuclease NurA [Candidatus Dependentiae bacterium]|nr:DNA double-strand break repair nuclease NurA [Candidatus Dependentiae bacterium]
MLNRELLAKKLLARVSKLFPDRSRERELARKKWREICADRTFAYRSQAAQSSFLVPRWEGALGDSIAIDMKLGEHTVIAIDGSQIYPDRHIAGAGCFLINTGGVLLEYGQTSRATFFSEPHLLLLEDLPDGSREFVDLKREEYELALLAKKATPRYDLLCESLGANKSVCFIDGSIIFWQLESKLPEVKKKFLDCYLNAFDELYKKRILFAGYISMPKSRELVSLMKLGLCRFPMADCITCHKKFEQFPCKQVDHMVDTQVARFFLKSHFRTTVFYSTSKIVDCYPEHLKPAFVYCDVGAEIVRLEVPTWIARDQALLNQVCAVAIDQSVKGGGYPVCLAEAHEQAVVKGGDREFFYHLLQKIGMEYNGRVRFSQKALKKRGIGV